jgi:hypothetical protein
MADVARKASCVESRDLARVLQRPHRGEIDLVRRYCSRGTMLRMVSTSAQNLTVPSGENLTPRRGDEPQVVATA